jgi:hypothetical protein
MARLKVPTKTDWGDLGADPEVRYGYKKFGGKSVEEALPLFVASPVERTAELRYSTVTVVDYYILCYVKHVFSAGSEGHCDFASVFIGLVLDRMQRFPDQFKKVFPDLLPAIQRVADEQPFFDADTDIYGSFAYKRDQILALHASRDWND